MQMKPGTTKGALLSSQEAAEQLGIAYSTLLKKVKTGTIPVVRVGKRLRFRPVDIAQIQAQYDQDLLSSQEVMQLLSIAYSTLLKKVKNGEIPALRQGKYLKFKREDLEDYVGAALPGTTTSRAELVEEVIPTDDVTVLDSETWLERYTRAGKPEAIPLDFLLTVSDAAFDATGELVPQFKSEGAIAASIVRAAPKNYIVAVFCDGQWRDVDTVATPTDACWVAYDVMWRAVHEHGAEEDFVLQLRDASLAMYRLQIEKDVRRWRAKQKAERSSRQRLSPEGDSL
ncbi:helix-turn-helix domain-containing protein [Candidatus Bathyarchaeota archaeon]|nr:helix-turn-helix domain-containing protein [Candidatus Bathyarchaeota archaeon]